MDLRTSFSFRSGEASHEVGLHWGPHKSAFVRSKNRRWMLAYKNCSNGHLWPYVEREKRAHYEDVVVFFLHRLCITTSQVMQLAEVDEVGCIARKGFQLCLAVGVTSWEGGRRDAAAGYSTSHEIGFQWGACKSLSIRFKAHRFMLTHKDYRHGHIWPHVEREDRKRYQDVIVFFLDRCCVMSSKVKPIEVEESE